MTTTTDEWTSEDLLNSYQVAGLLGMDPEWFNDNWRSVRGMKAPRDRKTGRWTPDEVRDLVASIPPGSHGEFDNWVEDELLTYKQAAAIHSPPIKPDSFAGYVRRAIKRAEQGKDTTHLPPAPEIIKLGHPLFAPDKIGHYLRNRPGPGYFVAGPERESYRGGRKPGTIPKRVRRVVTPEPAGVGAE